MDRGSQILVVAPSNAAADNIAERLHKIPAFQGLFLRIYGDKREDLFHCTKKTLQEHPYRLLSYFFNSHHVSLQLRNILDEKDYDIGKLNKREFDVLVQELKNAFDDIAKNMPIIITTCQNTLNQKLQGLTFSRVIIDEAAQAKEIEIIQSILDAKQVVMIGDQQQLGPVYKGSINGCDSMFSRLIHGGYPYIMLNKQYRMNPKILNLPNHLFYDDKI